MSTVTKPLEELIQDLPPHLRVEVTNFVEILLSRQIRPTKRKLRQDWADTLKADGYTSVELQHLASDWRAG